MTITYEEMINSIVNMYTKEISLPNFLQTPYIITQINLKNQQYYFHFYWSIREQRCCLSIFKLQDGERKYYLKNKTLTNGIELSKYIYEDDWTGLLLFENVLNNVNDDYTISDISEKFVIRYYLGSD